MEDDLRVGRFIEKGLTEANYACCWVRTAAAARDQLCETSYDVIILDLGLPDEDGLSLLNQWRSGGFNEPVLILSARDSLNDRVQGLNRGADDYLPKPFGFEELLARVRSLMRRQAANKATRLEHGGIQMDLLAHQVRLHGEEVELTNREFSLLELFLQNVGRTLTRTQIAERIWDAHYDIETNLIDVYVRRLRKKLEHPQGGLNLRTIRGIGYQMAS